MAIEAKATLLNEMERALATEVTAAERDRILAILTEKLDGYDLTIVRQDGIISWMPTCPPWPSKDAAPRRSSGTAICSPG